MKAQPRIVFVDNSLDAFRRDRMQLVHAARDLGLEVHVAAPRGRAAAGTAKDDFAVHTIPMTRKGTSMWKEPATVLALLRLYRSLRPSLVHHLRLKPVLYGSLAANLAGVPAVVNTLTGLGFLFTDQSEKTAPVRKWVEMGCRRAFRHPNLRVVFQNPDDRAVFIRKGILTGEQAAVIKGSGVDLSVYRPSPERDGLPVVILASRMLWDKGVAQFAEAARILKSEGVQARFALVGEPDPDNPAAIPYEQLEVWHESGEVEWWGLQSPQDMPAVLAMSHIVCLPSYREGIPRILIEAAASGRPIVTTDAPGCRELVRPGMNGIIVPSRDTLSLAAALRYLIEHPEVRVAMGNNNRQVAVQEFSQELVIAQFMAVYRELLRAASLGPTAPSQAPTAAKEKLRAIPGSALPAQLRSQGRS
jgi:glycosyltransferase involved in cell wall biosynthesis